MTTTSDPSRRRRVTPSSAAEKEDHRWVEAEPARRRRAERLGATVHTPEALHNEFGPGADLTPDPPLVTSLATLAATLGIALLAGERLLDAEHADEAHEDNRDIEHQGEETADGGWSDSSAGYDSPVFTDPSLLLDDD